MKNIVRIYKHATNMRKENCLHIKNGFVTLTTGILRRAYNMLRSRARVER